METTNLEIANIQRMINYTNTKIVKWYSNVKKEYNVIGSGKAHYNKKNNTVVVEYIENGEQKTWSMAFYPEYLSNGLDWVFNCWGELA